MNFPVAQRIEREAGQALGHTAGADPLEADDEQIDLVVRTGLLLVRRHFRTLSVQLLAAKAAAAPCASGWPDTARARLDGNCRLQ